ncbi:MAG: magnesium-translocating P-type ATPase [Pisciglobus halotolerans]|nr:magnesium-translocating P-type ATPase [Pisciglobus halotolerans]
MKDGKKPAQDKEISKNDQLKQAADLSKQQILEELETSETGLSNQEVENRLEEYGLNEIASQKPTPWYTLLGRAFKDSFIYVLAVLMIVSIATRDYQAGIVMAVMILFSAGLHFFQEYRAQKASTALKEMIETTCAVTRDGKTTEIPMDEVVPGDIVELSTGDMIPSDSRVLWARDLFINQASLTGESMPVEKLPDKESSDDKETTALDFQNLAFMGTDVLSGQGRVLILRTGEDTLFGDIARRPSKSKNETSFERGVSNVSKLLIRFMIVMVPIVFLINGISKGDWLSAFFFSIAVAVGLTPEMLPMIVTSNLAKGAMAMSKEKVIVKKLNAIQNLGAMDILCTDKTGTLTQDKVVLVEHLDSDGEESERVLDLAYINSAFQTGWKNVMDHAVINYFEENQKSREKKFEQIEKIDEIPFDFARRRLTVAVESKDEQWMITKGAIEGMLEVSSYLEKDGEVVPLTDALRRDMKKTSSKMNEKGMRVLGLAYRKDVHDSAVYEIKDEKNMILTGFMGFLDPPKESAAEAVKSLHHYGVNVKILTGDNEIVAQKICEKVGIEANRVLSGTDIDKMSEEELMNEVEEVNLFAKLEPNQKARIIEMLQDKEHTVGFMGDGVNDTPALRSADVGISVDSAADITKEVSSIILLEKSLLVLEDAVLEGRTVFGNMMKYIKMTISSNFGNVFSILAASAFLPFLPMLSIQLLVQNLLYDAAQLTIPWDKMDEEEIRIPTKWRTSDLMKFTLSIGPISSVFDIATFLLMWFVFHANSSASAPLFHSGWFVIGLITQTIVVHIIRTKKIPFIESTASISVILSTLVVVGIALWLPGSSIGSLLGFVALPASYWKWMILIVVGYTLTTQVVKRIYITYNKHWLL